jgi:CheY-like chemotaxis protein
MDVVVLDVMTGFAKSSTHPTDQDGRARPAPTTRRIPSSAAIRVRRASRHPIKFPRIKIRRGHVRVPRLPWSVQMKGVSAIILKSARRPPTEMLACEYKIRQPFCDAPVLIQIRSGELDLAKILVVDDDIAVQATIRILLERVGHSVVVASDGRKGLAIFETGEFDLLFLDIFMPGMDGLETMRLVHQQQPLIPIIVISGNPVTSGSGPDFLTMATKLGAVSSLQKPFKPAALLAAVAGSLEAAQSASSSSLPAGEVASRP